MQQDKPRRNDRANQQQRARAAIELVLEKLSIDDRLAVMAIAVREAVEGARGRRRETGV
jgi:hypothetical protein